MTRKRLAANRRFRLVLVPLALWTPGTAFAQSATTENVATHGAWRVWDAVDVIDDSVETVAMVTIENDDGFALACRSSGTLEVMTMLRYEFTGFDRQRSTIYRVDQNEPLTASADVVFDGAMTRLDWRPAVYAGADGVALIEQARSGSRIAVRVGDHSGIAITRVFPLNGFTAATTRVLERCGYAGRAAMSRDEASIDLTEGEPTSGSAVLNASFPQTPLYSSPGLRPLGRRGEPGQEVQLLRKYEGRSTHYLVRFSDGTRAWVSDEQLDREGEAPYSGPAVAMTPTPADAVEAVVLEDFGEPASGSGTLFNAGVGIRFYASPGGEENQRLRRRGRAGDRVSFLRVASVPGSETDWYLVRLPDDSVVWVSASNLIPDA